MSQANLGDKYSHRVTVRLNDDQFKFLIDVSEILGVSPSEYIRMTVNTGMVATKKNWDEVKGVGTLENVKTDCNNLI